MTRRVTWFVLAALFLTALLLAPAFAPALLILAAARLRPGEAMLLRLRARRLALPRAPRRVTPHLDFVAPLVDRLLVAAIAVRPPPAPATPTH